MIPIPVDFEKFTFPKDVRFECSRCALCCGDTETKRRMILLLKSEVERISQITSKKFSEFAYRKEGVKPYTYIMRKTSDGKCVFLKDNLCTIYGIRPLICRFYPFRLDFQENKKYVFDYTNECPGIGKGPQLEKRFFNKLCAEFMESMKQNSL